MTYKDLFQTACKALGLFFIIQAVLSVKQMIMFFMGLGLYYDKESLGFIFGQFFLDVIFYGGVAWILITKPQVIGNKLMANDSTPIQLSIAKSDILEVIVIGIGLVLVILSFSQVLGGVLHFLFLNDYDRNEKGLFWDVENRTGETIFAVVKLAVGYLAMTNGRTIARKLTEIGDKHDNPALK